MIGNFIRRGQNQTASQTEPQESSAKASSFTSDTGTRAENTETMIMENIFGSVSTAFSGAFREAASMADDMHAIIVADEDDVNKKRVAENKKSTLTKTTFVKGTLSSRFIRFKTTAAKLTSKRTRSSSAKEEVSTCDTLEDETSTVQSTSADTDIEVKGNPADLAKLMMKLDKQAKQIEKLKQHLCKIKEEELETRKAVHALEPKFCDVLDESVMSDDKNHTQVKKSHADQILEDLNEMCPSFDDLSDDDSTSSDLLDDDCSTSKQISQAFNQAIFSGM